MSHREDGGDGVVPRAASPVLVSVGPRSVNNHMEAFPVVAAARVSVVIGIRDQALHHEVLDYLGRHPQLDIAGSAVDAPRVRAIAGKAPEAVLVTCPIVAANLRRSDFTGGAPVLVSEQLTVAVLREAISAGAQAAFEWPREREDLARTVARAGAARRRERGARGRVFSVAGARGGVGATFVATHLTAAFAARGGNPVLVDADPLRADVTAALGLLPGSGVRTIRDLLPVIDELSPDHLEDALYRHPGGFSVLLAPEEPDPSVRAGLYRGAIALLALAYDPVVVHLARPGDPSASDIAPLADTLVLVTSLDLFSLYGAKRTLAALGRDGTRRCLVVVNRPARSPLGPKDIQRVVGVEPSLRIRADGRVRRAQDHGRLLPPKALGAGRDVRRLAGLLAQHQPGDGRAATDGDR